ncbi:hypothetical protein HLB30_07555 [Peptostreptococcus russellii]|uniref:hypothetical protein n=1 Tax=Peptostreptococcus russellii TaxID=215200 RepID=UPI0016292994|nr:hypothetical protein [Peptostreptococcus russellii]MBC2578370.1 hypothetical protein [Peptostreptococcus russellii]
MLRTMEKMYVDALEMAIQMGYKVVKFVVNKNLSEYLIEAIEVSGEDLVKEIDNTKKFGLTIKQYEIIDFKVVREWNK